MNATTLRDLDARCARLERQLAAVVTAGNALTAALPGYIGADNWNARIAGLIREHKAALAAAEAPPPIDLDALPADVPSRNGSKPDKLPLSHLAGSLPVLNGAQLDGEPQLPPAGYVAGAATGRLWAVTVASFADLDAVKLEHGNGQPQLYKAGFFDAAVAVLADLDGAAIATAGPRGTDQRRRTRIANSRRA